MYTEIIPFVSFNISYFSSEQDTPLEAVHPGDEASLVPGAEVSLVPGAEASLVPGIEAFLVPGAPREQRRAPVFVEGSSAEGGALPPLPPLFLEEIEQIQINPRLVVAQHLFIWTYYCFDNASRR